MKKISLFKTAILTVIFTGGLVSVMAQPIRISGVVSEKKDGEAIPLFPVTVMVKGTTTGAMTDAEGKYTITVQSGSPTLTFSMMGYKTVEVAVGSRSVIDVTMAEDATVLEDLVVVGYGSMRRSDLTGSIASINTDEMKVVPTSSIAEMLRGRAAGVTVTSSSGRPGAASNIEIRGVRSLKADNKPLYVVDGAPVTETEFAAINGADVASIEILKDAASQAIYGARAANGVILVTTKRGDKGRTIVNFNSSVSIQKLWRNFDFYSGQEWYELRREAIANDQNKNIADLGVDDVLSDAMLIDAYNKNQVTNWESLMLKPSVLQQYDLSISGGSDRTKVAASMGYMDQKGMVVTGSGYQRGNLRLNVDHEVYKWLSIGFNTSFSKTKLRTEEGSFNGYITANPYGSPYNEDGTIREYTDLSSTRNPIYNAQYYKNETTADNVRVNSYLEIRPIKNLTYKFSAAYFTRFSEQGIYKQAEYPGGGSAGSISNSKGFNYVIDNILTYNVPLGEQHRLTITGVQSYDRTMTRGLGYGADQVPIDAFWWDMIADGVNSTQSRSVQENVLLSYAGRAHYSFKDRYLVSLAVRHDGSSRFGAGNRWGTFPSAAVAWRISEEPMMEPVKDVLSNLKLRVSWGVVGNQNGIGNYTTQGTTTDYPMEFGGDQFEMGYLPAKDMANKFLKWESTASTNIGLDYGFLNNRITGSLELYLTNTSNLLCDRQINGVLGYTTMLSNLGKTRTKGVEVSVVGFPIRNNNLTWSVGLNYAASRNKIVKIDGQVDENGKPVDNKTNGWFIGQPINVIYDYKTAGIFQYSDFDYANGAWVLKPGTEIKRSDVVAPGKVKVVDRDQDGSITPDDRYVIATDPKFVMSLFTSLEYKGIDLFMDWYGVYGSKKRNAYLHDPNSGGSLQGKLNGIKVDYWTPNNPTNEFPRPTFNSNNLYQSSIAVQDASYLRLRSLSIGYTFPRKWMQAVRLNNLRVFATATNLLTFTKFLSYSPELSPGSYPESKQYAFGFNVSF